MKKLLLSCTCYLQVYLLGYCRSPSLPSPYKQATTTLIGTKEGITLVTPSFVLQVAQFLQERLSAYAFSRLRWRPYVGECSRLE